MTLSEPLLERMKEIRWKENQPDTGIREREKERQRETFTSCCACARPNAEIFDGYFLIFILFLFFFFLLLNVMLSSGSRW